MLFEEQVTLRRHMVLHSIGLVAAQRAHILRDDLLDGVSLFLAALLLDVAAHGECEQAGALGTEALLEDGLDGLLLLSDQLAQPCLGCAGMGGGCV